ncbi:ParB N-terminal domain-containing protein, partial [Candidatus Babeliales bacterium]|nr:ParB N-terminal domain-containing protein [Candidatus Babeliales bacterium]
MSLLEKYVEIPVDKLVHADWNYKKTDDKASLELMEKLKKNIAKNDQIENLLIREAKAEGYFEVVNGNHRLTALEALNKKSAVCFNLGKITQAHAERIAVETNETKFAADPLKLAELMVNIQKEFSVEDLIETMPMSADEIENYTKLVEFDWEQYNEESNIDNNPDDTDIQNNEGWRNLDI